MTDPRKIIQVTGQMRQMGEWGILLPDEAGQTDATQYFNSKEEAETYMKNHPWSAEAERARQIAACSECQENVFKAYRESDGADAFVFTLCPKHVLAKEARNG